MVSKLENDQRELLLTYVGKLKDQTDEADSNLVVLEVCSAFGQFIKFYLVFVDGRSHHVWVYPLSSKSQVFETFCHWQRSEEKESGRRVRTLRTDNGREYTEHAFRDHLRREGIRHETTVPKTPEQNGTAEWFNRTLLETTRSMLSDSQLAKSFWAEALSTATYLRNRSPTMALNEMTPVEAWTGKQPHVQHLRVFGCDAYAHVPRDERDKLDPKVKKCWFLGYGVTTKAYRLYDRCKRRTIFSRDVTFSEGNDVQTQFRVESDSDDSQEQDTVDGAPGIEITRWRRSRRQRYGQGCKKLNSDQNTEMQNSPRGTGADV